MPTDAFSDDDDDLDSAAASLEADLESGSLPKMTPDEPASAPAPAPAPQAAAPAIPQGDDVDDAAGAPPEPAAVAPGGPPPAAGGEPSQAPSGNPLAALLGVSGWSGLSDDQIAANVREQLGYVQEFQQQYPVIRQQLQRLQAMENDPRFIEWQRSLHAGPQQPQQPAQPAIDPVALENYYRTVDPQTGAAGWRPDTPASVKQGAAMREIRDREFAQQFLRDPLAAMQPIMQPEVDARVQQALAQYEQQRRQEEQTRYLQAWTQQNADLLYQKDIHGRPLWDPISNGYKLSPIGHELYSIAQGLQGIPDPLQQLQIAQEVLMARRYRAAGVDQLLQQQRQAAGEAQPGQASPAPAQPAPAANPAADKRLETARRMASRNPSRGGVQQRAEAGAREPDRLNSKNRLDAIFDRAMASMGINEADLYAS